MGGIGGGGARGGGIDVSTLKTAPACSLLSLCKMFSTPIIADKFVELLIS